MLKALKNFFTGSSETSPGDNPTFIRLVQIMESDQVFRQTILKIINLDSFQRTSMINSIISDMQLKNAPKDHQQTLKALTDDGTCRQIRNLIQKQ